MLQSVSQITALSSRFGGLDCLDDMHYALGACHICNGDMEVLLGVTVVQYTHQNRQREGGQAAFIESPVCVSSEAWS